VFYLVANWKANKTINEAQDWLQQLLSVITLPIPNLEIIIAAPFTVLSFLKNNSPAFIKLAAQNVSRFSTGAYTGEIPAEILTDLVDYVIIGHSERRRYFQETNKIVAQKTEQLLKHKITPIVCLDEPYLQEQIKLIHQLSIINHDSIKRLSGNQPPLIFAYEPLGAIGSGKPDTPLNANRIAQTIKTFTFKTPVLYGGSVTPQNTTAFLSQKEIDGLLIGKASLNVKKFSSIINHAKTQTSIS